MKKLILSLILTCSGLILNAVVAKVNVEPLSLGDLDHYFKSIHAQDGGLAFLRNPMSRPFVCQIGNRPAFISEPGSVFEVKFGSHFRLYNKHSEIKFLTDRNLLNKGIRSGSIFLVEEATLRNSAVSAQTIHVGYLGLIPPFGAQLPVLNRGITILNWRKIETANDLWAVEKGCGDIPPAQTNGL